MKKLAVLLLCFLIVSIFILPACTSTKTVTVTSNVPGPSVTITLPGSTQKVTIPPLTGTPPLAPHNLMFDPSMGQTNCFNCHGIPRGHEGRSLEMGICDDCHKEGPQVLLQVG
jgi:hypothetical protein